MTTFVAAGTVDSNPNQQGGLDVVIPANAQAGDLAIAMGWVTAGSGLYTAGGWSGNPLGGSANYMAWRLLTASDPGKTYTFSADIAAGVKLVWVIYRGLGLSVDAIIDSENTNTTTAPQVTTSAAGELLVHFFGTRTRNTTAWTPPPGETLRYTSPPGYLGPAIVTDVVQTAAGPSAPSTATGGSGDARTATVAIKEANTAPNAPIPTSPVNGGKVDRSQPVPLQAAFSDPDAGDSPSASKWRYRLVGGTWTDVTQNNPLQSYSIPAGLAAGDYEWQAAYADQAGVWGPYSASAFFTAADPLPGPVWLHPTSGETITTDSYTGQISAPTLDASEWTLYADNAGAISTTVLQGPILVTTGDLRSHTFTGLTNNTPVWWSVRDRDGGLWSPPVQVRTPVAFTTPVPPLVTLTPDASIASIIVGVTNPPPTGAEPAAAYNNVYVLDDDGDWQRLATLLSPNTPWTFRTPRSGVDYAGRIKVETVSVNGTTAVTVTDAGTLPATDLYGGGY